MTSSEHARAGMTLFAQLAALLVLTVLLIALSAGALIVFLPPGDPPVLHISEAASALERRQNSRGVRVEDVGAGGLPSFPRDLEKEAWLAKRFGVARDAVRLGLGRNLFLPHIKDATTIDPVVFTPFYAALRQASGGWLLLRVDRPQLPQIAPRIGLGLLLAVSFVLLASFALARRLTQPISSFAAAAERFGDNPSAPPLAVRGPREARVAIRAFNRMQAQLRSYVANRVRMVGAVAHDLRTPLTRLKLKLEGLPDDVRASADREIALMDAMINSALAFVKESERAPDRRRLHLLSLVESVVDDLGPKAAAVTVRIGADPVVEGDALALGRLVANLLDNALKYAGAARCVVSEDVGFARFEVEDDGPGVAPDEIEGLFEPFVRGAVQRATAVDGLGLGLSIVRTIAEAHGGYARIANRPSGGLTAAVRLPLAPIAG